MYFSMLPAIAAALGNVFTLYIHRYEKSFSEPQTFADTSELEEIMTSYAVCPSISHRAALFAFVLVNTTPSCTVAH